MEFDFLDWDDEDDPLGNLRHVAEHGVTAEEVEQVLSLPGGSDARSRSSRRPIKYGWTETGKYLVVVYEVETAGGITVVRPVTAYEVDPA